MSKLYVVGIGPGDLKHMTYEAREAIESADTVVGYKTYLDLIVPLLNGKDVVSSGMTKEVERCREALRLAAAGRTVALVSSGDAGVYGMAGLVLELSPAEGIKIVIVPGVSAVQAAASVLGAPLMHDFAVISLSDLLTPWELIEKRLAAAAAADFVVALYNPRSKGRVHHIQRAQELLLASCSPETPVGIVRNACREGEEKILATLGAIPLDSIDMFSLVIIGNSATYVDGHGRMVTPRGYSVRSTERGERRQKSFGSPLPPHTSRLTHHGKAVMFVGTGSDVGKSVLAAGFCRILSNRGLAVAPFKSQNMALNSFVTPEGGEIGRAQAVQAQACRIAPHTDMNPVLLKPNSDTGSQVIVQGQVVGNMAVKEYNSYKPQALRRVEESYQRLAKNFQHIVIEGAGSIAEINLRAHDIANLRIAEMADCPCLLVADIDRGGVFAQIVGTWELLEPQERERIKGVIINKFRGDPSLLASGIEFVEQKTGIPVLGVVPYFSHFLIPEEDSVALERKRNEVRGKGSEEGTIRVGVVRFPRISNFTDFDPLEAEPDVDLRYIDSSSELDDLDLLILPGSKSTISDLEFLRHQGLFERIKEFDGLIVGICGGYQMLGRKIFDPDGVESSIAEAEGLGILDVETTLLPSKETHQAEARLLQAALLIAPDAADTVSGYEIHMGNTTLGPTAKPFCQLLRRSGSEVAVLDGAASADGRVFGSYLHGIFDNQAFRTAFLNRLRREKGMAVLAADRQADDPFDLLAAHLERHLDLDKLLQLCGIDQCPQ